MTSEAISSGLDLVDQILDLLTAILVREQRLDAHLKVRKKSEAMDLMDQIYECNTQECPHS